MPHREGYLLVCTNRRDPSHPKGSCGAKDADAILASLKEALTKRGLARRFRACGTTCIDLCEIGATVIQEPQHVAYGNVTPADAADIVAAMETGGVVERLVVEPPAAAGGGKTT